MNNPLLGDDDINRDVVGFCNYLVYKLKVVAKTYEFSLPLKMMERPVVVAFSESYPFPRTIEGNARDHNKVCLVWSIDFTGEAWLVYPESSFAHLTGIINPDETEILPTDNREENNLAVFQRGLHHFSRIHFAANR